MEQLPQLFEITDNHLLLFAALFSESRCLVVRINVGNKDVYK